MYSRLMAEIYNVWLKQNIKNLVTIKILSSMGYMPLPLGYIDV